ncbi:MAG: hypothetical protein ACPGUY_10605, partial [Akkermansiaceae bacterium]
MKTIRTTVIATSILLLAIRATVVADPSHVSNNNESTGNTAMVEIPAGEYIPLYTTDKTPRKVAA